MAIRKKSLLSCPHSQNMGRDCLSCMVNGACHYEARQLTVEELGGPFVGIIHREICHLHVPD